MDLPDCPPGAEGYEDTAVIEVAKKPDLDDSTCTKAELEFKEHFSSLKIKVEDGSVRCMLERRGRDVSGKWIYLCYPCAAVCSGELILQTHISGKKHKTKLALKTVWPTSIFDEHPYVKNEKGENTSNDTVSEKTIQKMAEEVSLHNTDNNALDAKYGHFRRQHCQIQSTLDKLKAPLLGIEYLLEFPPEEAHHEPSYTCVLCNKMGAPRTIVNHLLSFWHRIHYLWRHFPTTHNLLQPYRTLGKYREGVSVIMNRLMHRIEECYGRLKPVCIEKDLFNKEKDQITQWVFKGYHFSENSGQTFAEIVDIDLITSLERSDPSDIRDKKKEPSPPIVAAPTRHPKGEVRDVKRDRLRSVDALSDDLSVEERDRFRDIPRHQYSYKHSRDRAPPYPNKYDQRSRSRERHGVAERIMPKKMGRYDKLVKPPNYEYKLKVAEEQTRLAEQAARKILAYHEKNPEKHPLYPEEWKKFWNKRYKELQSEGKEPSKHDFKPEWIVFWTKRMKELHNDEMNQEITEIHRKLNLPPPSERGRHSPPRRSPPRRSPPRRRSPPPRRRSRSPPPRRRSPPLRRRSRSPSPRRPISRQRSRSPLMRNHSPHHKPGSNPYVWRREEHKKSLSPLSIREAKMQKSPSRSLSRADSSSNPPTKLHSPIRDTVLISDDELKVDPHSPWNGSDSLDSLGSLPDAKSPAPSHAGSSQRGRQLARERHVPESPDDVVSTLRLLVALEDYLGSLGPKIIDLLTLALKMEKEKPNSSEQLLENELSVSLVETAKEKLKGAVQAGLVSGGAVGAARKAVTKAAAFLHEADKRQRTKKAEESKKEDVAVAGVGAVDKAAIAKQMAAALIAQGKTDVTTEELAQLVDAVVGMAEAKKREAQQAAAPVKPASVTPLFPATAPASVSKNTASALQLLQSAYDENEKKMDEIPDVMDGLSDSDLKTLLQNFSELSAEEQHGLIAYLKKLEAKDPSRVERLREFVSSAVSDVNKTVAVPPPPTAVSQPGPSPKSAPIVAHALTIDSEDDDYAVEEVFKSVAEKVKENQIRQEMEVVTKLLNQETKVRESVPAIIPDQRSDEASKLQSSAANVLALMQASVHSSIQTVPANSEQVHAQANQRKLFGDKSEESQYQAVPSHNNVAGLLASLMGNSSKFDHQNQPNNNYGNIPSVSNPMPTPNNQPDQKDWAQPTTFDNMNRPHDFRNQIDPVATLPSRNQRLYRNEPTAMGENSNMTQQPYGMNPINQNFQNMSGHQVPKQGMLNNNQNYNQNVNAEFHGGGQYPSQHNMQPDHFSNHETQYQNETQWSETNSYMAAGGQNPQQAGQYTEEVYTNENSYRGGEIEMAPYEDHGYHRDHYVANLPHYNNEGKPRGRGGYNNPRGNNPNRRSGGRGRGGRGRGQTRPYNNTYY